MKLNKIPLRLLFLIGITCCFTITSYAQISNFDQVIRAGVNDAEIITKAYLEPLPSGFGGDINSGWVNSAKPHKTLGFDLQVRGAFAFIPKSDESFDLDNLNLEKIQPADPSKTVSPTIGGINSYGPEVVVKDNGNELARFNLPKGSGIPIVPAPMIQAGIGLVRDTDIMGRVIPKITSDKTSFKMFGIGIRHGINQWLPGGNLLPVNLSIMGGFTNVDVKSSLDLKPDPGSTPRDPQDATKNFQDQFAKLAINTFTVQALVGKDLPFISFYGGIGYQTSTMNVDVVGNYPVDVDTPFGQQYDVITDPFGYSQNGQNKFSLLGGATLKLAFFNLFGEFSLAKYPTANAGIGFSFR